MLLCWSVVSWKLEVDPLPFLASFIPCFSVDYVLLTPLDSEVALCNAGKLAFLHVSLISLSGQQPWVIIQFASLVSPLRDHFSAFCCFQSLSPVWLFATPWTIAHQASLSFSISQSLLKLMPIESLMSSNISFFIVHFSCLQTFPASGSFLMSWLFASGGQSVGTSASASVLLMNIHDVTKNKTDFFSFDY